MAVWHIAMYKKSKLKGNRGKEILSSIQVELTQYLNFSGKNRFYLGIYLKKNTILGSSRPTQIEQHCVQ